jgi:uncharacterized delta-60 repeat protein
MTSKLESKKICNINGSLDTSFGTNGMAFTDFFGRTDDARALVLQPDGKIITAGYVYGSGRDYDFGLARYNIDGSLDRSFGSSGKIVTDIAGGRDMASALTLQPDGKIIAGGFASTSSSPTVARSFVALARYKSDGSLDSSFGVNGKMTVDFFGQRNGATALAMQADGKLVTGNGARKASFSSQLDHCVTRPVWLTAYPFSLRYRTPVKAAMPRGIRMAPANLCSVA